MGDPNQEDPYGSLFNMDMSQYPNLSADFSFEQPTDLYQTQQHQMVQLQSSHLQHIGHLSQQQQQLVQIPQQQLIQLPQQLVQMPQLVQQQLGDQQHFAPVNLNLLSFEPLPINPNTALLYASTMLPTSNASSIISAPVIRSNPVIRSTPIVQSPQTLQRSESSTSQQTSPALGLGPGLKTPPPLSRLQSTEPVQVKSKNYEKVRELLPKKRKPRTPKKQQPIEGPLTSGGSFKDLREFVFRLMEKETEHFADRDFAERALLNLSRKISSRPTDLAEWEKAIVDSDPNTGCVTVPRPKDGRMTVTKTSGGSTCKKVFPQILVCQIFRWPNIVFHHDIKSSDKCKNPAAVKPTTSNVQSALGHVDEDMDVSSGGEVICINPFHYVITAEAEARFRKANAKSENALAKQAKMMATKKSVPAAQQVIQSELPGVPKTEAMDADTSGDESESSDEILSTKSDDDDEVDYVKMWEEEAVDSRNSSTQIQEFEEEKLMSEIKFLTFDDKLKTYLPAEAEILEKLKVREEIKSLIFSGKLIEKIRAKKYEGSRKEEKEETTKNVETFNLELLMSKVHGETEKPKKVKVSPKKKLNYISLLKKKPIPKEASLDKNDLRPETVANEGKTTVGRMDVSTNEEDDHKRPTATFETSPEPEDDSSIRDLLADIQDSYVRQLDEEFHELSSPSNVDNFVETSDAAEFFNPSDPDLEIDPSVATTELPCIVNSWTMPDSNPDSNDANLIGPSGSISQEDFDNLFSDQNESDQQNFYPSDGQETSESNEFQRFHNHFQPF